MAGSLSQHWSVRSDYLWIFYTFQSNFIVTIYYGILIVLMFSNSRYFGRYSNLKARQHMGVYMMLLMVSIAIIFAPLEFFEAREWGNAYGAFPAVMSNQVINPDVAHYSLPSVIENAFVHFITPMLIIIDLLVLSEADKKYKKEHQYDWSHFSIFIFPIFYVTLMFSFGYTHTDTIVVDGVEETYYLLPYTIFSTDYYAPWAITLFTLAEVSFFLISFLVITKDKDFYIKIYSYFKK